MRGAGAGVLSPDARPRIPMSFANGLLLAGVGLIAVPIILHLVMRRQPKLLVFPAVQFLRKREESNRRQLRFRHLLLLALRCGVIALLALALARPSLSSDAVPAMLTVVGVLSVVVVGILVSAMLRAFRRHRGVFALLAASAAAVLVGMFLFARQWLSAGDDQLLGGQETPVAAVLVFDTTPRMDYRHENKTRIEAAQELGAWLVDQFPAESEIAVLSARSDSAAFAFDRAAARRSIENLKVTPRAAPLPQVLVEALDRVGESDLERREVFVFTDLAQASWPSDAAARLKERLAAAPQVQLYVIDVGVERPFDFGLGDWARFDALVTIGGGAQLAVDLVHSGNGGARSVELRIHEGEAKSPDARPDDRPYTVRGRHAVTLAANQSQRLEFLLRALPEGTHQGYVQIVEEDGLAWNNRRYLTLEVRRPRSVLLAAPKPARDYTLFLAEALQPQLLPNERRFDCETIDLAELSQRLASHSLEQLQQYAAIALVDPTPLPPASWNKLVDYVKLGGGVAVFLGRNARPPNTPPEIFNSPEALALLPAKLDRPQPSGERPFQIVTDRLSHPIVGRFPDGPIPWFTLPVYRYWRLGDLREGASVAVKFSTGHPAVIEQPLGKGHVVTMTTPVSDPASSEFKWNLLPTGDDPWPFMLLADGIFQHLTGAAAEQLHYLVGQTAFLRVDPRWNKVQLVHPLGQSVPVPVDPLQGQVVATWTDQPGNYRIRAGGTADPLDRGFSVNLPAAESRFERVSKETLDQWLGDAARYRLARTADEIQRSVNLGRVGVKLFPWVTVLLGVFLALELALGHWFYPVKRV